MARNYARDYAEIAAFARKFRGHPTLECIEAYAQKRKIVSHRAGKAFWAKVDDGEIEVHKGPDGLYYIV